ncbi:hypothetical protein [Streptomyces viridosporus]|uniref:hypothetical protein n=1 Tax=Streptomyces viridosporus TaxID=67581 RepID=UPI0036FB0B19
MQYVHDDEGDTFSQGYGKVVIVPYGVMSVTTPSCLRRLQLDALVELDRPHLDRDVTPHPDRRRPVT